MRPLLQMGRVLARINKHYGFTFHISLEIRGTGASRALSAGPATPASMSAHANLHVSDALVKRVLRSHTHESL